MADIPSDADSLEMRILLETPHSTLDRARRAVVREPAAWQELWHDAHAADLAGGAGGPPQVDFRREMALVAALGERRSGGYAVRFRAVYRAPARIYAVVEEVAPGQGCITTMAMTSPAAAVAVPRSPAPVVFVERRAVRDCR